MNGRRPLSPVPAAAWVVLALVAGACSRDSATTGPSHAAGKDFAANLRLVSGDQQVGAIASALGQPIKVKVVDAGGQPVQGATVTFGVRAGGGSINPAANISDATGIVSSVWTMGTSLGAAKVVALLTNSFVLDSTTFTATATVGPPRLLVKVSGDSQTTIAGTQVPAPVVIGVQDAYGNKLSGVKITWTPGAGSGTASTVVDTTGANGTASAAWTVATTAGVNTLAVSAGTLAGPVFTATGKAGAPAVISVTAGGNQSATVGTTVGIPPSVIVQDAYNNLVSGASVTFAVVTGGGSLTGATATTNASGIATVGSWRLGVVAGPQTLSVTAGSFAGPVFTATAVAGAPATIAVNAGNSQTVAIGTAVATRPSVIVRDANANPVAGASVTFAVATGGGTVTGANATTDSSGIATVGSWTLGLILGAQTLTATSGAFPPVVFTATATPGAATVILVSAGNNQSAQVGTVVAIPPSVIVRDAFNNPVSGVIVTFAVATGNGIAVGVNTFTNANGIATVGSWTLGLQAGAQTLTATSGTLPGSPVTFAATAIVLAPATIVVSAGNNQSAAAGTAVATPPSVIVRDATNSPVSGASVTFVVATGGGSVTGASATTNASGIATVGSWTLGLIAGAQTLTATTGALPPAVFTATGTAGTPTGISINAGNNQSAVVGTAVATRPSVIIRDANSLPVAGANVTFAVATGGGSVTGAITTTDASGTATVGNWTLGTTTGTNRMTATSGAMPGSPMTFTATATPDPVRAMTVTAGQTPVQTADGGSTLATTLGVIVRDRYSNPVGGESITWRDSVAGGGSVSVITGITASDGTASTSWTLGRRAGTQYLRVKRTAGTAADTVAFTATAQVRLTDVNVGNFSVCGLAQDGTSMCWGFGADGQLGKLLNLKNTSTISTSVSTADTLAGPFLTFRSLSVGRNHACGITIARDLYCWGANNTKQIGSAPAGGTPGKWLPNQVFTSMSTGEFNTCAITPTGVLYCSGANDQGQIGVNSVVNLDTLPTAVSATLYSAVAVGQSHVCAIPRAPATPLPSCWGFNNPGQIGDGSGPATSRRLVPTAVSSGGLLPTAYDSTSLVAGNSHSCAIAAVGGNVGETYCWGGNGFGQLGDGTTTNRNIPTLVSGGLLFTRLSAGAFHTCGLTAAGVAYCWGRNSSGQLGDNSQTPPRTAPVLVSGGLTFRSISAGELFTCAVQGIPPAASGGTTTTAGDVYCWGDNEYGQIGNLTWPVQNSNPRLTPMKISYIP